MFRELAIIKIFGMIDKNKAINPISALVTLWIGFWKRQESLTSRDSIAPTTIMFFLPPFLKMDKEGVRPTCTRIAVYARAKDQFVSHFLTLERIFWVASVGGICVQKWKNLDKNEHIKNLMEKKNPHFLFPI